MSHSYDGIYYYIPTIIVLVLNIQQIFTYVCPIGSNFNQYRHHYQTKFSHSSPPSLSLLQSSSNSFNNEKDSNNMLSFGNSMKIQIKFPTKDKELVQEFLADPSYLVESTWDSNKLKRITPTIYLLQFIAIPIPGIDIITPEIEVSFENINGIIRMNSGNWTIKGMSGKILKDSNFLKTFEINLVGQLMIIPPTSSTDQSRNTLVTTEGRWVSEWIVCNFFMNVYRFMHHIASCC